MDETAPIPKATICIVGTSHIARSSMKAIQRAFDEMQPDIVCVELDRDRLQALLDRSAGKKDERMPLSLIRQVGATGYLFALIARTVQKKLGDVVGVQPGVDMLKAVTLARENGKALHLVDQHIGTTMRHLSKEFTWREKNRMLWDVVSGPFRKETVKFDLSGVPDEKLLTQLMTILRERYPSIYRVLIIERNIVMARNVDALVRKHPGAKILLVVGAGHEEDLRKRFKALERLATIR